MVYSLTRANCVTLAAFRFIKKVLPRFRRFMKQKKVLDALFMTARSGKPSAGKVEVNEDAGAVPVGSVNA